MDKDKEKYVLIWGDTVIFKHLIIGLLIGVLLGYLSYIAGLAFLNAYHADLSKSLLKGYSLLGGIAGCIAAAVIAGKLFKPKRIFHEEAIKMDKHEVVAALHVDLEKETEYLQHVSPLIITEMKELHLYELFSKKND